MGLDMSKVNDLNDEFESDGKNVIPASKLGKETDIRILPPTEKMNGVYTHKRIVWWINKKPHLSNSTFGGADVIAEEVEAAKKLKDPDLDALIADDKKISQRKEWLMPVLILKTEFTGKECTRCDVEKAIILSVGKTLGGAINSELSGRYVSKDPTDRIIGHNLLVMKKGTGMETEYSSRAWQDPMEIKDKKYYKEENIPDVIAELEKDRKSDTELRSIIRNFLHGDPIVKGGSDKSDKSRDSGREERSEGRDSERGSSSRGATSRGRTNDDDDEEEDFKPKKGEKKSEGRTGGKKSSDSIDDDLEEMD